MVAPRNPPKGRGLARTPVRQSPRAGTPSRLGSPADLSPIPADTGPESLEDQLAAAQLLIAQLLKERATSVPPEPATASAPVYRHSTPRPVNLRPSVESPFEGSVRSTTSIQKLSDLPKLDDGTEPTWISWKLQAQARLRHSYLFPDEHAKLEFLYSRTTGMANRYLTPRMSANSWTTAAEIIEFLDQVFGNPNEVAEARDMYNVLTMETFTSFQEFWHEFLHLSGTAQIHKSHLLTDLRNKLSPKLQVMIIPTFHMYTSYLKLGQDLIGFDKRLRDIQAVEARTRAARRVATVNTSTQSASPQSARLPQDPGNTFATPKQLIPRPSFPSRTPPPRATTAPLPRSTPAPQDSPTCFNCGESGHYTKDCSKPKRLTHGISELEPDLTDATPDTIEGYDIERELEQLKDTT
jgi:hypothetical protein